MAMNREQKKKRQKILTVIAETAMVLAVVVIVTVMTMVSLGYKFGNDGEIEQAGLMRLHTMPTGATVELDGQTLFARSNLSESMLPGEHYIKISRDGYDTWEKNITMKPGSLMRLYSPRLFLIERETEKVAELGDLMFYSSSENRNTLLYAKPNSTKWTLVNIKNDEIENTTIDVAGIFSCIIDDKFMGEIKQVKWDSDEDKTLFKVSYNGAIEWVLVDLKDVTESVNITKDFGLNFDTIELANSSATQVLALENGNLRKIDINGKSITRILIEKVAHFTNHGADVIYVTTPNENNESKIGVYKDGAKDSVVVEKITGNEKIWVASSAYYDDEYLIYSVGSKVKVFSGEYPIYTSDMKKTGNNTIMLNDEKSKLAFVLEADLKFIPEALTVSRGGEYVIMHSNNNFTTIDLDTEQVASYVSDSKQVKWLDDSMLYDVLDGKLLVWDFDGANKREVVKSGVSGNSVTISGNNDYLYYMNSQKELVREKIR